MSKGCPRPGFQDSCYQLKSGTALHRQKTLMALLMPLGHHLLHSWSSHAPERVYEVNASHLIIIIIILKTNNSTTTLDLFIHWIDLVSSCTSVIPPSPTRFWPHLSATASLPRLQFQEPPGLLSFVDALARANSSPLITASRIRLSHLATPSPSTSSESLSSPTPAR